MKYKDISIRKKILLSNFLMVLIPIILVSFILFSLLLGFSFLTNSPSAMIRNVLLSSSNYGPTLLIKSMNDELASSTSITKEAKIIFAQLEKINLHILVEEDEQILYHSDGITKQRIQQEYEQISGSKTFDNPSILWNDKGMAYKATLHNKNGKLLHVSFTGVGLSLPQNAHESWENTKLMIKIGIVGTGVGMVLLLVLLGAILTRRLAKHILLPLYELQKATNEIKQGNLHFPVKAKTEDEFGQVCQNFEAMRLQLIESDDMQKRYEENRKELIAGISHDLSTPLTSIQGYVNGLVDGIANTPEKQLHYLHIIQDKTKNMNTLVESLFLLSKLDLKQEPFHDELIQLSTFMEEWYHACKEKYQELGLLLSYDCTAKEPLPIIFDRIHFTRVLDNLCQNSIKYRKDTIVHMQVHLAKEGTTCILRFQDDGSGIQKDEADRLFDRFYRSDPARSSKITGNGLGLSITKHIIEHMQGNVWAEGELDVGLCITIQLPLHTQEE